jgi:hypothetical protein
MLFLIRNALNNSQLRFFEWFYCSGNLFFGSYLKCNVITLKCGCFSGDKIIETIVLAEIYDAAKTIIKLAMSLHYELVYFLCFILILDVT